MQSEQASPSQPELTERDKTVKLHRQARTLAMRDLIELHPTLWKMLREARLEELKKEAGWVNKKFRENRTPRPDTGGTDE